MPVFQLNDRIVFPPPELAEPNGLLAVGGDLTPARLLEAYSRGIFPWFGEDDPLLWWSPAPRLVLFPEEFHLSRRMARTVRQAPFIFTADSAFREVIEQCAAIRKETGEGTWITGEMIDAYCRLHELGYAHSVECWQNGILAGGLYGIGLDRVFFGESMFSRVSNGSKLAIYSLISKANLLNIRLMDCQMRTQHLLSLGAREISRNRFQRLLQTLVQDKQPQKNWGRHWQKAGPYR